MISDPDRWAPAYAEAGAASVTFHVEAAHNPVAICGSIRSAGARAGVAVKPGTEVEDLADLLPCLDMILVMTVEPGFGGQSFMTDMLPKIRRARALADASGTDVWIQVDGGIDVSNIERCAEAGASDDGMGGRHARRVPRIAGRGEGDGAPPHEPRRAFTAVVRVRALRSGTA
jgi:ribulose-phosphate 3-epimerase